MILVVVATIGFLITLSAVEDGKESKIVILKKYHAEKLGIYHCTHCGMAFDSEIQLSIHQRIQYII